jgi:hypothetical protein
MKVHVKWLLVVRVLLCFWLLTAVAQVPTAPFSIKRTVAAPPRYAHRKPDDARPLLLRGILF